MAKRDSNSGGSFWTTTLGILTQIGAILGAIAGILAFVALGNDDEDNGGSGSSGSSITRTEESTDREDSATTREDWVQAMNALCGAAKSEAAQLGPTPPDVDEAIEHEQRFAAFWQQLVQAAHAIPIPESDRPQVERMLSLWNEAGDQYGQLANDIAKGDEPSFNEHLEAGRQRATSANAIAVDLGAERCTGLS